MRCFFSAGEASGDAYAEALANALLALDPSLKFEGVGGNRLRGVCGNLIADSSGWGAVGILEALKVVPKVTQGYHAAKNVLRQGRPGVFIPIDFGYMNVKLCRAAKAAGWKVLYFVPPGSWRRDKQGGDLPAITDAIITPFPWSAEILNQMGANAHYFGHPILEMVGPLSDGARNGVAVLPGSRHHEIKFNLQAIVPALERLNIQTATLCLAQSITEDSIKGWIPPSDIQWSFSQDRYSVMKSSQVGIICSGTATLEGALCGLPQVVVYRGSKWMELEYKIRKPKFDYISLPNILLNKPLLPELIQSEASPERIEECLKALLQDSPDRARQLEGFDQLRNQLQPDHAITLSARFIYDFMKS